MQAVDGLARAGTLHTPHGSLPTPAFMPVGTYAAVRTASPRELQEVGAGMILANTYHLLLRPGAELIAQLGGLHHFMHWPGALLTDSGGFQVFSLARLRRVTEDEVQFTSHLDGSLVTLSPERATRVQELLGADVAMCFDECPAHDVDRAYAAEATERTHRWAARCQASHQRADQALFGICQGGLFPDLRLASARRLADMEFPGYGIGGLSVGEEKGRTYELLAASLAGLPATAPHYMMGVGSPEDLLECVARGVDMFDCVLPTRIARNGALFTATGRLNIRNAACRAADVPIQEGCDCPSCRTCSRAYLHHLFNVEETLGLRLATLHNLRFLLRLMEEARAAIAAGSFARFRSAFLSDYQLTNQDVRRAQKARWLAAQMDAG
ncbi:MAG TPA: tRNA guanosine(34) transglycosylase Tgt [Chloroflexota bacterium]|nr:tRNA guanosine(34) transglycosylase Tgt [Chloroflexota bacterium]